MIVMRRYPGLHRLAALVQEWSAGPRPPCLPSRRRWLGSTVMRPGSGRLTQVAPPAPFAARWQANLAELHRYADSVLAGDSIDEMQRLATQFIDGRAVLFAQRITDRRIVDGHADLLADDIFCLPDGPVVLDCLEFDDRPALRRRDRRCRLSRDGPGVSGSKGSGEFFLESYSQLAGDGAACTDGFLHRLPRRGPRQGRLHALRARSITKPPADALRHLDIALDHLRAGTVRLVLIGGGPGTGKTTLAHALAEQIRAQVISTDDVRRRAATGGDYQRNEPACSTPAFTLADNVAAVYDAVLRRAHLTSMAATR